MKNKDEITARIIIAVCVIVAIAIVAGAVVVYRKYQFSLDVPTYSAVVIVLLYYCVWLIDRILEDIADDITDSEDPEDIRYSRSIADDEPRPAENDNHPLGFRRPIGIIPDLLDPAHRFTDINGHEYRKLGGIWYDDNGNFAPDYMKDYYGLTRYEEDHE